MITGKNVLFFSTNFVVASEIWSHSLVLFLPPSLQILGNVGASLQREFFTYERLSEEIAGSVFVSLDHIPDHRLRPVIHILCHANNAASFRFRSCARITGIPLTSVTVVCEEFGTLLSSRVLWGCGLPPAGPSFHLHVAGQDVCTRPFWLKYLGFNRLICIEKNLFVSLWFL